ncbi:MAG: metallophosphoesterase [Adhaeribacter sp.]
MLKYTILLAMAIFCHLTLTAQTILVPFGATWQYLDNGSNQGAAWRSAAFNDEGWKTGKGKFGYGLGDEATPISFGPEANMKYTTTYFRKEISVGDLSAFSAYTGRIKRDDGVVVYLNGAEVYRNNLPGGSISYTTRASSASDQGKIPQTFSIEASAFESGRNVIAVEIHQTNNYSYDLSFDLELSATGSAVPPDDETAPTVLSLNRHAPASDTTTADSVSFRIIFSQPVTGVEASDFQLSGTAQGSITGLEATDKDSTTYDIIVGNISSTGTLGLNLKSSDTGISDAENHTLVAGFTGQTYTIRQAPDGPRVVLTRGPYLQMGSSSAMTLRWRTDKAADSRLEVGTTYGTYPLQATNSNQTTEHEVRISGLKPGTRYYYRFGSATQVLQSGRDNFFTMAPAANSQEKVRVAVLGDCGRNEKNVQTKTLAAYLDYVQDKPAELLLLLGDNAYSDGTDAEYQKMFFNAYSPTILKNHVIFPAPGNHDYHTTSLGSREAPYYKVFTMPAHGECGGVPSGTEAFYSYDWGNIHFISLDSYGTENPDESRLYDTLGTQVRWLKKDLAATSQPWVIVYWHHPPYSMGSHNSDTEGQLVKIRQNLLRILERNGVDLVLTGHSHNYERSYLLQNYYGNEASFNLSRHTASTSSGKDDGSKNSDPYVTAFGKVNHGTVYVVSGSSGAMGNVQSSWPHNAMPFSDNEGGMFYLEVEQNRLEAKYLRSDGKIWDQFTIMKEGSKEGIAASRRDLNPKHQNSTGAETDAGTQIFPTLISRGARVQVHIPSEEQIQAQVVDMNGRLVSKSAFNKITFIETRSLPAGVYFIRLQGKNYLKTQRFMVRE